MGPSFEVTQGGMLKAGGDAPDEVSVKGYRILAEIEYKSVYRIILPDYNLLLQCAQTSAGVTVENITSNVVLFSRSLEYDPVKKCISPYYNGESGSCFAFK